MSLQVCCATIEAGCGWNKNFHFPIDYLTAGDPPPSPDLRCNRVFRASEITNIRISSSLCRQLHLFLRYFPLLPAQYVVTSFLGVNLFEYCLTKLNIPAVKLSTSPVLPIIYLFTAHLYKHSSKSPLKPFIPESLLVTDEKLF